MGSIRTTSAYFRLRVLTPVHVGCGQDLDPFHYFLADDKLNVISFTRFISGLNEDLRSEFMGLVSGNSVVELRKFLFAHADSNRDALYSIDVHPAFGEKYRSRLSSVNNQMEILAFFRSGLAHRPIIPGSSIKGAIRTAVLSSRQPDQKLNLAPGRNQAKELEARILGNLNRNDRPDITHDPFKTLGVTDAPMQLNGTVVAEVVNYKTSRGDSIPLNVELARGAFNTEDKVDAPVQLLFPESRDPAVKRSVELKEILSACNLFSSEILDYEEEKFFQHKRFESVMTWLRKTRDSIDTGSQCMVRLGRFSQAESKTIPGYRDIQIHPRKRVFGPEGNTRNIMADGVPLGWCLLEQIDEAEYRNWENAILEEDENRLKVWSVEEAQKQAVLQKQVEEDRVRRLKQEKEAEEARKKREAEEKALREREAQLAQMSREDRWIAMLPKMSRDETMQEVFPDLASIEDEQKKREVAKALRERWVTLGSWNGKQTPKQQKKIQAVKDILSES